MTLKVLILGGGGYLGQGITELFVKKNIKITIVDRFFYKDSKNLIKNKLIRYIKEDARRLKNNLFKGMDITIDLTNVSIAPKNSQFYDKMSWEINYDSRKVNLELSKKNGVKRYLFPTSCSVYGFSKQNKYLKEEDKLDPKSTYSKTHKKFEEYAMGKGDKNFCVTALRLPTLFGVSKRTRFDVIINSMVFDVLEYGKIKLLRDGKQRRPFVHVKDVARAFFYFSKKNSKLINNQIYNIGDKKNNINLHKLSNQIFKILKIKKNIEWYGKSDDRSYFVSFLKLNNLGFKAIYDIAYGINELKKNYKKKKLKRKPNSINMVWLDYLENLNKSKNLTIKDKNTLKSKLKYNGILEIN